MGNAAGIAETFRALIDGPQEQIFTAGGDVEALAVTFDDGVRETRERAEGTRASAGRKAASERWSPASQVFPQEIPLRMVTCFKLFGTVPVFDGVGLLQRQHSHELQFEADVIHALVCIGRGFQAERMVKCGQISETMGLDEWIGFQLSVFDFVERAWTASRVAECGDIVVEKVLVF